MVWWLSTAAVFTYIVGRGVLILRAKRGFKDFENSGCPLDNRRRRIDIIYSESRQI